jgi:arylsulfatase A-like enzyme
MARNILLITTDQQRYDSLGCNGGAVARTPVVDGLAAAGINYHRAHAQNVLCSPARSSILTGLHPATHGVRDNGIALPLDDPSLATMLADAGYRTALLGKAHFEPNVDFDFRWTENRLARDGSTGPYRGFEHVELALHGYWARYHYDRWLEDRHPEDIDGFLPFGRGLNGEGDTEAPDTKYNPMPREHYHTDWIADRTIAFLDGLPADANWFVWMSFPDPHSPWDPPAAEARRRVPWRDLDLPVNYPRDPEQAIKILAAKPHHWLDWYEGRFPTLAGPGGFVPGRMTADQVREVNALVHVENELIDEACGRVLRRIDEHGWERDTDVFFTTDHGELQGDFGLLFKGPHHVDALMRIPLVWRPAPAAGVAPCEVTEPVGQLDLAPTCLVIAGLPIPEWMQGAPLPTGPDGRERVITEWDSEKPGTEIRMRSIYRDGWLCTEYLPTALYEGTEGELYDLDVDPKQWENRWDDPQCATQRADLLADLHDHAPPSREPLLPIESIF